MVTPELPVGWMGWEAAASVSETGQRHTSTCQYHACEGTLHRGGHEAHLGDVFACVHVCMPLSPGCAYTAFRLYMTPPPG